MKLFPFFFCLFAVWSGLHILNAQATVNQDQENLAEILCNQNPSLCGLK
jgi:hypothetical protein